MLSEISPTPLLLILVTCIGFNLKAVSYRGSVSLFEDGTQTMQLKDLYGSVSESKHQAETARNFLGLGRELTKHVPFFDKREKKLTATKVVQ